MDTGPFGGHATSARTFNGQERGCGVFTTLTAPASPGFSVLLQQDVNPTNAQLFPVVAPNAKRYQEYRFRRLRIRFRPAANITTYTGYVGITPLYNMGGKPPASVAEAMNMSGTVSATPVTEMTMSLDASPGAGDWRYVSNNQAPGVAGDQRLSDVCTIFVWTAVSGATTGSALGVIEVDYDLEFRNLADISSTPPSAVLAGVGSGWNLVTNAGTVRRLAGALSVGPNNSSIYPGETVTPNTFYNQLSPPVLQTAGPPTYLNYSSTRGLKMRVAKQAAPSPWTVNGRVLSSGSSFIGTPMMTRVDFDGLEPGKLYAFEILDVLGELAQATAEMITNIAATSFPAGYSATTTAPNRWKFPVLRACVDPGDDKAPELLNPNGHMHGVPPSVSPAGPLGPAAPLSVYQNEGTSGDNADEVAWQLNSMTVASGKCWGTYFTNAFAQTAGQYAMQSLTHFIARGAKQVLYLINEDPASTTSMERWKLNTGIDLASRVISCYALDALTSALVNPLPSMSFLDSLPPQPYRASHPDFPEIEVRSGMPAPTHGAAAFCSTEISLAPAVTGMGPTTLCSGLQNIVQGTYAVRVDPTDAQILRVDLPVGGKVGIQIQWSYFAGTAVPEIQPSSGVVSLTVDNGVLAFPSLVRGLDPGTVAKQQFTTFFVTNTSGAVVTDGLINIGNMNPAYPGPSTGGYEYAILSAWSA